MIVQHNKLVIRQRERRVRAELVAAVHVERLDRAHQRHRPVAHQLHQRQPGTQVFPSHANFFLVRVPDADGAYQRLRAQGVLVRNFNGAHPMLANCLRITVGNADENRRLLAGLDEVLR